MPALTPGYKFIIGSSKLRVKLDRSFALSAFNQIIK